MSANTNQHLIHMANQIATYFAPYPHEEAVTGVTTHLQRFWEPRMRRQLAEHIAHGGVGLDALVLEAAKRLN